MAQRIIGAGISAPMLGSNVMAIFNLLSTETQHTLQTDITAHLLGNTASMQILSEFSFDGGQTWPLTQRSTRDKGYALLTESGILQNTMFHTLFNIPPQQVTTPRQVRNTLIISGGTVVTFMQAMVQ